MLQWDFPKLVTGSPSWAGSAVICVNNVLTLTELLSEPFRTWWQLVPIDIHSWGRDRPLTAAAATSSHILTRIHPAATHMHSQTHTYAAKVWKRLCMITEQPKAPRGINNRPNPETTNTISRLQREVGGLVCWCVCVWMWGVRVDMNIWLACVRAFLFFAHVLFWYDCVCMFDWIVWLCECEQRTPALPSHRTGWPPRTCWLLHSNPPKTFTP